MHKNIKAPAENAENKEPNVFNLFEVAGAGVKKSVEMLLAIFGRKQDGMESIKPTNPQETEILAIAKHSVNQRKLLAQELMPASSNES